MIIQEQRTGRFANLLQLEPDRWRDQLLDVILRVTFVLGTIVAIPSIYLSFKHELPGLAVVDILALLALITLRFSRRVPLSMRAKVVCVVFFGVGVALLVSVGPAAQIYLLGFSLTATFLLGHRAGFVTSAINTLTLFGVGVAELAAPGFFAPAYSGDTSDPGPWIVVALNFTFINLALVAITSSVLSTVAAGFDREARGRLSLQHSQALLSMALRIGRFGAWSTSLPELRLRWADIARGVETFDGSRMATVKLACEACLPADGEALARAFESCCERGVPFELEVRLAQLGSGGGDPLPRPDDQWLRWMGEARRDADGKVVGAQGALQDISVQKRLELQLRDRERRAAEQAELLDKAQDAILVLDLEGRVNYLNRRAQVVYGFDPQDLVGRDLRSHLAANLADYEAGLTIARREGAHLSEHHLKAGDRALVVERRWTLLTSPRANSPHEQMKRPWGPLGSLGPSPASVDTSERPQGDTPYGVMIIDTDVTEQRRLQEQLLRSQRLESIGTLASGIAHDLNNVLTPVLMAADMLRMTETDTERLADLDTITTSAKRASDMVRQILGFARGFTGDRVPFDVGVVMADLARMIRETFPKGIVARIERPEGMRLVGDATQVTQVLVNLCVNARDAMPDGGEIHVSVEAITLDAERCRRLAGSWPGTFARFVVRDTGVGMDAETLGRIYEPFFTTKEVGKGTGLGLFTTHAIVSAHLGFIAVESVPGAGTNFEIYLPLASEEEPARALPTRLAGPGRGERVLMVEDEDALRAMAARTLERAGYAVVAANNGAEALEAIERDAHGFDLVLTDINMPVMDGAALIRALRERKTRARIIAVSGLPMTGVEVLVDATLSKPYVPQVMLGLVREVLDCGRGGAGSG